MKNRKLLTKQEIKDEVENIVATCKTCNPFNICEKKNIVVNECDLGSIQGYFVRIERCNFICLNSSLSSIEKKIVCSHELGHFVLHSDINTLLFSDYSNSSIALYEKQADVFACYLLLREYEKDELCGFNIEQISSYTGIPLRYLKLVQ